MHLRSLMNSTHNLGGDDTHESGPLDRFAYPFCGKFLTIPRFTFRGHAYTLFAIEIQFIRGFANAPAVNFTRARG